MRYTEGQKFERRTGQEMVIINDLNDHFMEIAEEVPVDEEDYRCYIVTTGNLDSEQELGFIEQADSVSEERVAEIREMASP